MKNFIPKITSLLKKIYPIEIISSVIIIGLINYFYFQDDPGFFNIRYNPYFIVIIFFSCFYGKLSGITTLLASVACIAVHSITVNYDPDISPITQYLKTYFGESGYSAAMQFLFISFILAIMLGEIRDTLGIIINKHKNKIQELSDRENKLEHEIKAISLVNEEYQDRILGQQNSLISLYTTMIALNSLDMEKIYPNILEAVVKFSGAVKCSLWQYMRDDKQLLLLASHGWNVLATEDRKIPDSNNITGWVARNNELFSVKLLQKHANLLEIDKKQNIITVPVNIGNHVWGIINVEEIPFVKYNLYSEQLIMMIADLSAPIIGNAIRFDEISKKGEVDKLTGLPSLDEMFSVLRDEFTSAIADNTKLSFVVIELNNSPELLESYPKEQVLMLLGSISQMVKREAKKDIMVFQYKGSFQISLILPNMDYDGAAMLCLSVIEIINKNEFKIGNNAVHPEIILGYSSIRPNMKSEEDLMMLAENLLEIQKI